MIRQLTLHNWRAYDELRLDLEPGTTFVVARNGIGKSSLIEAAAWALYGERASRPQDVVRNGGKTASASVELVLPDYRVLRLTRSISSKLATKSNTPATAELDGVPIGAGAADQLLRESFNSEPAFLSRLTMLRGLSHGVDDPSSLELQENLSRIFGIDGLQRTATELEVHRRELKRNIEGVRASASPTAKHRAQLLERVERAREEVVAAEEAHAAATVRSQHAQRAITAFDTWQEWKRRDTARQAQLREMANRVDAALAADAFGGSKRPIGGPQAGPEDTSQTVARRTPDPALLTARLDEARSETADQLDSLRMRAAVLGDRIRVLENALSELGDAAGQCPVCRRPLSQEDEAAARLGHERDLAALREELARINLAPLRERLVALESLRSTIASVLPVPAPDRPATLSRKEAVTAAEEADAAVGSALNLLVEARGAAAIAKQEAEAAEADALGNARLAELYRRQALLTAAAVAVRATVNELMEQTIAPLAAELSNRCKWLLPDRGDVRMVGGKVHRALPGYQLPFGAFSDGEKTSIHLLLRLLVLDAVTRSGFCWIDEPLEHLDPDTRRAVASLLARTATNSGLRQVLVTTYEEPLARQLARRHPDHTRVVYVRPGSADRA